MAACSIPRVATPALSFVTISGTSIHFPKVQEVFTQKLAPLYGDQTRALTQIKDAKDRTCELLLSGPTPVGLLVYKDALQNEFKDDGIVDSLELKTLIVIDSEANSGKGYGTSLNDRVIEVAKRALAKGVHVTVSDKVQGSLSFFQKKGYSVIKSWNGKNQPDVVEYLLHYSLSAKIEQISKS